MTTQLLRQKILELAIQGKLALQRPEEGTAEELYKQIQVEKQALIKSGKLKKEKPLPEITDNEKAFDIPQGWIWVRLGSIVIFNPKNDLDDNQEVSFIPMALVKDGYHNNHTCEIRHWGEIKKGFTHFADGDIGIAKITPCFQNRKSVIFSSLKNGYGAGTTELSIVRAIEALVSRSYLFWLFKSGYFIENGVKSFTGTVGQQRIHKDYLSNLLTPLPPLAEQKRIVAKIEELFHEVDAIEKAQVEMTATAERMKRKLLELAIQGKLAEQDPNDEPASVLLERIRAEKKKLIAAGKIKKDKNESVIFMRDNSPYEKLNGVERSIADEVPFDEIPNNWTWVRLGTLFQHNTGKALNRANHDGEMLSYITTSNLYWNRFDLKNLKTMPFKKNEIEKCTVTKGDLLVIEGGFYFGRAAIWNFDFDMRIQNHIHRLRPYKELCIDYFYYIFFLYKQMGLIDYKGIGMQGLSSTALHNLLLPLPPLAEQKRIVAKIEQLLSVMKNI